MPNASNNPLNSFRGRPLNRLELVKVEPVPKLAGKKAPAYDEELGKWAQHLEQALERVGAAIVDGVSLADLEDRISALTDRIDALPRPEESTTTTTTTTTTTDTGFVYGYRTLVADQDNGMVRDLGLDFMPRGVDAWVSIPEGGELIRPFIIKPSIGRESFRYILSGRPPNGNYYLEFLLIR